LGPETSLGEWLANAADAAPSKTAIWIAWRLRSTRFVIVHYGIGSLATRIVQRMGFAGIAGMIVLRVPEPDIGNRFSDL
jgi:hypothetical protein